MSKKTKAEITLEALLEVAEKQYALDVKRYEEAKDACDLDPLLKCLESIVAAIAPTEEEALKRVALGDGVTERLLNAMPKLQSQQNNLLWINIGIKSHKESCLKRQEEIEEILKALKGEGK